MVVGIGMLAGTAGGWPKDILAVVLKDVAVGSASVVGSQAWLVPGRLARLSNSLQHRGSLSQRDSSEQTV